KMMVEIVFGVQSPDESAVAGPYDNLINQLVEWQSKPIKALRWDGSETEELRLPLKAFLMMISATDLTFGRGAKGADALSQRHMLESLRAILSTVDGPDDVHARLMGRSGNLGYIHPTGAMEGDPVEIWLEAHKQEEARKVAGEKFKQQYEKQPLSGDLARWTNLVKREPVIL